MLTRLTPTLRSARQTARRVARSHDGRRWALLIFILAVLAFYKTTFTRFTYDTQRDGGYYTDIAAHISKGDGLVTSVCLIHKGCTTMPHPADTYPLWPLLYGNVARFFPLVPTGKWLATSLYFASLVFGYLWGSKLVPGPLIQRVLGFDAGHVFVLMLGVNKEFFKYTTFPYSDGLAQVLVLLVLWRSFTLWKKPSWRTGIELGLLLGLAFLARSQTLVLTLTASVVFAFAVLAVREHRKPYAVMAVCAGVTFCAVLSPYYFHLKSFVPNLGLKEFVRFDERQFNDVLTPVPVLSEVPGIRAYLADRWEGVPQAFALEGNNSYRDHMYNVQYALPLSMLLLVVLAIRHARRADVLAGWQWLRSQTSLPYVYGVIFSVGAFMSLHTMHLHPTTSAEWLFGGRWAVPCLSIFFLSMVLLFRYRLWRVVAIFLLATSVYEGGASLRDMTAAVDGKKPPQTPAIVKWLNKTAQERPGLIVADRDAQPIAYMTPGVGYHWYYPGTTLADVEAMVTKLGVDYLVVPPKSFRFMSPRARFDQSFRLTTTIGKINIYEPTEELLARRSAERPAQ